MKGIIKARQIAAENTLLVKIELTEAVNFKPGQAVRLCLGNDCRYFSIANSPDRKTLLQIITRLGPSPFKKHLASIKIGEEVFIKSISGSFALPESNPKPLIFIAFGIGITPFLSMLEYANDHQFPNKILLIYQDRSRQSMVNFQELLRLQKTFLNFLGVLTLTHDASWQGEHRALDEKLITDYVTDPQNSLFFLAGPLLAVNKALEKIKSLGVEASQIFTDEFTGYPD